MKIVIKRKTIIEGAILLALIAGTLLYIVLRSDRKLNYSLPAFESIELSRFSSVEIYPPGDEVVRLERSGDIWVLDDGYPADPSTTTDLLRALGEVTPVDLVSQSGNHGRYGLDSSTRHILKGYRGDKLLRELHVGKSSSSGSYNYVLFPGDKRVYTLRGSVIKLVQKERSDFRNKEILDADRNLITSIQFTTGTRKILITKNVDEEGWSDSDGTEWDEEVIRGFIGRFESLRAVDFPELPPDSDDKLAEIVLGGAEEYSVTLFPKGEEGYPVISSGYPFAGIISEYTGDSIMETFTLTEEQ